MKVESNEEQLQRKSDRMSAREVVREAKRAASRASQGDVRRSSRGGGVEELKGVSVEAVKGKRVVVDYEEEGLEGEMVIVQYAGTVLAYDAANGLLVVYDGYDAGDEDGEAWVEDGVDDWEWDDLAKAATRAKEAEEVNATAEEALRVEMAEEAAAKEVEDAEPARRSSRIRGEAAPRDVSGTAELDGREAAVGQAEVVAESGAEECVEESPCVAASGKDGTAVNGPEGSDDPELVKGKKRSAVAGKRVIVDYEELVEKAKMEIVRYTGVVLTYSAAHGLLVRFDGFADDDEEGETWVEENGLDDWDWEVRLGGTLERHGGR